MKTFILVLLFMTKISLGADQKCEVFQFTGKLDLSKPAPQKLIIRHSELQKVVASHVPEFRYCQERAQGKFGQNHKMVNLKLTFEAKSEGVFVIDPIAKNTFEGFGDDNTFNNYLAECYSNTLKKMKAPKAECPWNLPYRWDGSFPLINTEQVTFPASPAKADR